MTCIAFWLYAKLCHGHPHAAKHLTFDMDIVGVGFTVLMMENQFINTSHSKQRKQNRTNWVPIDGLTKYIPRRGGTILTWTALSI